jgi:uncharacterized protein
MPFATSVFATAFTSNSGPTVMICETMTGAPWRGAIMGLIVAAAVGTICLILPGLTGDFLVDWLWFSGSGYLEVFWTTIVAEAEVFFIVFVTTAIVLWVNGSIASRYAGSPWTRHPANFELKRTGVVTLPDVLEYMRRRHSNRQAAGARKHRL